MDCALIRLKICPLQLGGDHFHDAFERGLLRVQKQRPVAAPLDTPIRPDL